MASELSGDVATTRVSTTQAVVLAIAKHILSGVLTPGTRLREVEVSERYGVSRQTLRAAVIELNHMGLVEVKPNRGIWVRQLSLEEIEDLKRTRALIEGAAAAHAAANPSSWPELERHVARLNQIPEDVEWWTVAESDWNFHHGLVEQMGSPTLSRLHETLRWITGLSGMRADDDAPAKVHSSHRELLDTIMTGDPEVASESLAHHLEVSVDMIRDRFPTTPADHDGSPEDAER
jgi:DNA-binding GntR family transcriptional regulator